ncbi:MAG: transcription elongation factor GreA [Candidatus Aenigmarchaeota archaeon]|nr:transcription elongation factor GreA [Candidatus Aenigmarchaeota archaeon]
MVFLTKKGLIKFEQELDHLINQKRSEISVQIRAAREMGDLSENAAYQVAKEEQKEVEDRIAELKELIKQAELIEDQKNTQEIVQIGSQVKLLRIDSGTIQQFMIVGPEETNPGQGRISYLSPIGQALLDHRVNDKISPNIKLNIEYKILAIK